MKTRGICTCTGTALRGSDGMIWLALSALSQMDWKTSRSYALAPPLTPTKCEVAICSHTPMSTMGHAYVELGWWDAGVHDRWQRCDPLGDI